MGFLKDLQERVENGIDEEAIEQELDLFLIEYFCHLCGAVSFAHALTLIRNLDDRVFREELALAMELDARFYTLSAADQEKVRRQISAGIDHAAAIKAVDPGPLSAKARRRLHALEQFYVADFSDPVPTVSRSLN